MELKVPSIFTSLSHRLSPKLIGAVLIAGLAGWVGWQFYLDWFDRPLPPSTIQAHELRVNSGQLNQLNSKLETYQHPVAAPTVTTSVFSKPAG